MKKKRNKSKRNNTPNLTAPYTINVKEQYLKGLNPITNFPSASSVVEDNAQQTTQRGVEVK